ncbi:murein hydrolase activator EnvC family protein [Peribacillus sp. SCS-26]|uniref:murein hydrolase activator EnvC family protein n=1 Tax=Paraperibacillus marinus TaxID=3115295 RepID=UPI003906196E
MRKIVALIMAALLVTGLVNPAAAAASLTDMQVKKKKIETQQNKVQSGIHAAENRIQNLQGQQKTLVEEIEDLNKKLLETAARIEDKTKKIEEANKKIEELNSEILIIMDRIQKREELLKERARAMQQNGGNADYLEVILGAKSFGNFLERVSAVSAIMEADRDIIREQEEDQKELEKREEKLKEERASLQTMLEDLKNLQAQQNRQKASKKELIKKLRKQEQETHSHKMDLKEEEELLTAQAAAIQQAITLEKKRLAELEAARKRAAEEAAMASVSGTAVSGTAVRPSISSGTFTTPASGILSSNFGPRSGGRHMGVDIANSGSNVTVVSAADGVVSKSYLSSSYGNVIFVTHSIKGKVYTTVYAHLKARYAGTGQVVAKGQQIGVMGNTGESRGQHLHFELHQGPWNQNKTNALNPIGIVPF